PFFFFLGGSESSPLQEMTYGVGAVASLDGMRSFWPTVIRVVVKLFAACNSFTVIPLRFAMVFNVSPDFTVYVFAAPVAPFVGAAVAVAVVALPVFAGITSFWPIFSRVGSTPGFASWIAREVTPYFFAIVEKE